jgi:hypothetical protein
MEFTQDERIYSMDSVLNGINGYENKTPRDIIDEGNGNKEIFKLIKRGYRFDDEVLNECNISREIRDDRVYLEIAHHSGSKPSKTLKKDTAAYEEIVESLSHMEVEEEPKNEEEEEEMEEFFEHDDD